MEVVTASEFQSLVERVEALENKGQLKELLDADTLCEYLSITKQGMYNAVKNGRLPHYKAAKKLYFKRSEIDELINQGKVKID